jgi:hypothetical protein
VLSGNLKTNIGRIVSDFGRCSDLVVSEIFMEKWLGFAVAAVYVLLFVTISMHIPWYIGNFYGRAALKTPIILPYGLVVFVMTGVVLPNPVYQGDWINYGYTPFVTALGLFVPLIMAIVHLFRKKPHGGQ